MALHVHCQADPAGCRLHVRQDGCDPSPRWLRYYAVVSRGYSFMQEVLYRCHRAGCRIGEVPITFEVELLDRFAPKKPAQTAERPSGKDGGA